MCFALSLILVRFSSLEIPRATSTWKSQDFPNKQIDELFELIKEDNIGSFSALCSDFLVIPNAVKLADLKL